MVSATMGVGSLVFAGFADPAKSPSIWITWWLGDVGGKLLVTPFIVLWARAALSCVVPSCSAWACYLGQR
jgi:integral membrane sensor domain MASE1